MSAFAKFLKHFMFDNQNTQISDSNKTTILALIYDNIRLEKFLGFKQVLVYTLKLYILAILG